MLGGKHHGTLSDSEKLNAMTSQPGNGTNFYIYLIHWETRCHPNSVSLDEMTLHFFDPLRNWVSSKLGERLQMIVVHTWVVADYHLIWDFLCISGDSEEGNLRAVSGLSGLKNLEIAAGAEHSAIITGMVYRSCWLIPSQSPYLHVEILLIAEDGAVKTWGWGEHGQLGLGDTCDHTNPQTVNLSIKLDSAALDIKVYCGSGFTVATTTPHAPSNLTNWNCIGLLRFSELISSELAGLSFIFNFMMFDTWREKKKRKRFDEDCNKFQRFLLKLIQFGGSNSVLFASYIFTSAKNVNSWVKRVLTIGSKNKYRQPGVTSTWWSVDYFHIHCC